MSLKLTLDYSQRVHELVSVFFDRHAHEGLLRKFALSTFVACVCWCSESSAVEERGKNTPSMHVQRFELIDARSFPDLGLDAGRLTQALEAIRIETGGQFTIAGLSRVTQTATDFYRTAGLFLATAYLPEQNVVDGVVKIQLLYGELETLQLDPGHLYSEQQLSNWFDFLMDRPAQASEVETASLYLNDLPGFSATAVLVPGGAPGKSALIIEPSIERSTEMAITFDNHGGENTGTQRLILSGRRNNPFGFAGSLNLNLLKAFSPSNSLYGGGGYEFLTFHPSSRSGISYALSSYEVGGQFSGLGIVGDSQVFSLHNRTYLARTKDFNLLLTNKLDLKRAKSEALGLLTEDALSVITPGISFDMVDSWFGGRHRGEIKVGIGLAGFLGSMSASGDGQSSRQLSKGGRVGGDFTKIELDYAYSIFFNNSYYLNNSFLLSRFSLQQTQDNLVAVERSSLGGAGNVRAYNSGQFLADTSYFFSVEFVSRASNIPEYPWLNELQLAAFFDMAYGKLNDFFPNEEESVTLSGPGLSAAILPDEGYRASLDLAFPMSSAKASDGSSFQVYFSLGYQF